MQSNDACQPALVVHDRQKANVSLNDHPRSFPKGCCEGDRNDFAFHALSYQHITPPLLRFLSKRQYYSSDLSVRCFPNPEAWITGTTNRKPVWGSSRLPM